MFLKSGSGTTTWLTAVFTSTVGETTKKSQDKPNLLPNEESPSKQMNITFVVDRFQGFPRRHRYR